VNVHELEDAKDTRYGVVGIPCTIFVMWAADAMHIGFPLFNITSIDDVNGILTNYEAPKCYEQPGICKVLFTLIRMAHGVQRCPQIMKPFPTNKI
jgi:hypothetical protein